MKVPVNYSMFVQKYNDPFTANGRASYKIYTIYRITNVSGVWEQMSKHPSKNGDLSAIRVACRQERQEHPCITKTQWKEVQPLQKWRRRKLRKKRVVISSGRSKVKSYMFNLKVKQISCFRWNANHHGGASQGTLKKSNNQKQDNGQTRKRRRKRNSHH